jgi:galactokinase/galacturonokinase
MGIAAWNRGDMKLFGRLMNESCLSSFVNYEVGSPELVALEEIISTTEGVYGSRLNGGGYGGSVTAFVKRDFSEDEALGILDRYRKKYPGPGADADAYFAGSDEGLRLL